MSRRLPAWLRYWFPKPRPPRIPEGVRGPYDPLKAARDDLLLMAARRARTPQHSQRVVEKSGRRALDIAQDPHKTPRRWRYKLRMLIWRASGYVRLKRPVDGFQRRVKVMPRIRGSEDND